MQTAVEQRVDETLSHAAVPVITMVDQAKAARYLLVEMAECLFQGVSRGASTAAEASPGLSGLPSEGSVGKLRCLRETKRWLQAAVEERVDAA